VWRLQASGDPVEVARLSSGVTDVTLGPDGLVYVSTADAISTMDPAAVGAAAPSGGGAAPSGGDGDGSGRAWVVLAAGVVLTGALVTRFLAGRRHRPPP